MAKGFLRKLKEGVEPKPVEADKYIDLGELEGELPPPEADGPGGNIRVAELHRYEDLSDIVNFVYDGSIVLIDFSPLSGDELVLRRITNELKSVIRDVSGDLAGFGKNYLVVAPTGVRVDRKVFRGSSV